MDDTVPPPPAPQDTWSPAGFWIRLLADIIDSLIVYTPVAVVLGAARPVDGFCAGVPPESAILATVDWRLKTCASLGYVSDQSCARLLSGVQRHCGAPETYP